MKFTILFFLILSVHFSTAEVEEKTLDVYSETDAVKDVIQSVEKKLTEELVLDILGLESIENLQNSIQNLVLPQNRKFILSSQVLKTHPVEKVLTQEQLKSLNPEQKFVSSIRVRFSKDTLRQVLIDKNLYYLDESSNRILLLIEFEDEVNRKTYRWWSEGSENTGSDFLEVVNAVYSKIQLGFLKNGFYALNPVFSQLYNYLPEGEKSSSLNKEKAARLATYFKAQLVVMGSVKLSSLSRRENQIIWDVAIYNADTLRQVALYKSRFKVEEDSFSVLNKKPIVWVNDSALKINSLYQKGTLSAQLFKVDLEGDLSVLERKEIKNKLVDHVQSIKNLTESVIEANRIQYDADVNGDHKKVVKEMRNLNVAGYEFSVLIKKKNYIVIRVKSQKGG